MSAEQPLTLTDDTCARLVADQATTAPHKRSKKRYKDTLLKFLKAELTTAATLKLFVRAQGLNDPPWGTFGVNGFTAADARLRHEEWLTLIAQGMDRKLAFDAVRAKYAVNVKANTPATALDVHGTYLEERKKNPTYASEAARWPQRRKDIELILKPVLNRPFKSLSGPELLCDLKRRYTGEDGVGRKQGYNSLCQLRNVMKRNGETQAFPKPLADYVRSAEVRDLYKMPKPVRGGISLRLVDSAKLQRAVEHIMAHVDNGYLCTHLAAILMGGHHTEIRQMRFEWIKLIGADRFCHFPGEVMKGDDQLNPAVSKDNDNHVYLTARMWKLIVAHREAAGVPIAAEGPIWLTPKTSRTLPPRSPIIGATTKRESVTMDRLYNRIKEVSGLEHWGQLIFRRTFISVAAAAGGAAHAVEMAVNHKFGAISQFHYFDNELRWADQCKASMLAAMLVEAWLAEKLGETGDNVRALAQA